MQHHLSQTPEGLAFRQRGDVPGCQLSCTFHPHHRLSHPRPTAASRQPAEPAHNPRNLCIPCFLGEERTPGHQSLLFFALENARKDVILSGPREIAKKKNNKQSLRFFSPGAISEPFLGIWKPLTITLQLSPRESETADHRNYF